MINGSFLFFNQIKYPDFEYGDLAALHPTETFAQLTSRRQSNYALFKTLCESQAQINLPPQRLEIDIPNNSQINSSLVKIYGKSQTNTQLVVYPFTPTATLQKVFNLRYGDTYTIRNLTITSAAKNYLFETYSCILKPGGVSNAIEIIGPVRADFWDEMVPGKTVWYGWTFSVLGETKIIDSVDEINSIIYLTTNISGSVASDTHGANVKFGTLFKQDISLSDYITYGSPWVVNYSHVNFINASPASNTGTECTVNIENVTFSNCGTPMVLSMGSGKVNFSGSTRFYRNSVGFSFFARSQAGGQTVTVSDGATLLIEENGDYVAGAVSGLEPSGNYGSGGYLHDSIIVKSYGTIHLKNNTSASWRQYSSSYGPATGDFSYYANLISEGSLEYDFLMSNTMPTVIDNLVSTGSVQMRHDTTINGGNVADLACSGTDFGLGSRSVEFNNTIFRGRVAFNFHTNGTLNNCEYRLSQASILLVHIQPGTNVTINGGIVKNGTGQTINELSRLTGLAQNMLIDGLEWEENLNHYFISANSPQMPYLEKDYNIVINNVNCKGGFCVDGLSVAGTVSKIMSGTNTVVRGIISQHRGRGFVQNISGRQGTKAASIVASKSYEIIGALTNILEVDFEHDVYEITGGGTINAIIAAGGTVSFNPQYGRNIRVSAIGAPITVNVWNPGTNPTSNILTTGFVIAAGSFADFSIDREHIFKTGTTTNNPTVGTGNGATKIYKGVLPQFLLDTDFLINVTAGSIDVDSDSDGLISHADLVGFIDYFTGKYELRFTNNVPNAVPIVVTYNYPTWRNTGAWIAN